jgi:hypothetical protein
MSSNHVRHLIIRTITVLQHFATLHHTPPNYTSLNLSTLHFPSFTLHYPLIWLNPFTFPTSVFPPHTTKLDTAHFSRLQTYFQNNEPLHCPKGSPHHFTSLNFFFLYFFTYPINPSLHFAILIYISLPFTFYF